VNLLFRKTEDAGFPSATTEYFLTPTIFNLTDSSCPTRAFIFAGTSKVIFCA
jgi:hypothetical protein